MACGADGWRAPFVKLNISDVMSCDLLRWRVCSILQRRSDRHWLNSNVSPDACVYVLCACLYLRESERWERGIEPYTEDGSRARCGLSLAWTHDTRVVWLSVCVLSLSLCDSFCSAAARSI